MQDQTATSPFMYVALGALVVAIAVITVLAMVGRRAARRKANEADAERQAKRQALLADYGGWIAFLSPFDDSFVGIDSNAKQIALGNIGGAKRYSFNQLISVEVDKDDATVTQHDRSYNPPVINQTEFQEQRALLNAIQSPTTSIQTVRQLSLNVTVDDPASPVVRVTFFHSQSASGVDPRNSDFQSFAAQANQVHALLLGAIHQANSAGAVTPPNAIDTLQKLWDLKTAGAITEAEFNSQKSQLLSES